MTTIADSLVAIIVAHYGDFAGGATPAEIYNVLDYKTTPPFPQHTEQIAVWRPEPTERDPINENYVDVVHTVKVRISTNTSDDRLKEIVDEVRLVINARGNGVTGVTHQFVSEEDDLSVREDDHFIFELTARLEYDLIPAEAGYDGWDFSPSAPHDHDGDTLIPHALNIDESKTVVRILDQDGLSADAADALATQQSIKAYVDDSITDIGGTIDADSILIPARKASAGSIPIGAPVYVVSWNSGLGVLEVEEADADDAGTMPAIGLAHDVLTNAATGFVISAGVLEEMNTNSWNVGDALYVDTTAGTLTSTRPTATGELVQKVAQVIRKHITLGTLLVFGAGRSNDIPNDIALSAITNLEESLMSGSANKAWKPLIYMEVQAANEIAITDRYYFKIGNPNLTFLIPGPYDKEGSQSLKLDEIRIYLADADVSNYVDRIRIFAAKTDGTIDVIYDNGTNQTTTGLKTYTPGADIDFTGYSHAFVYMQSATNANDALEMTLIEASFYYS